MHESWDRGINTRGEKLENEEKKIYQKKKENEEKWSGCVMFHTNLLGPCVTIIYWATVVDINHITSISVEKTFIQFNTII